MNSLTAGTAITPFELVLKVNYNIASNPLMKSKSKLNNAMVMLITAHPKSIELATSSLRLKSNLALLDRTESEETQPIPAYDDPLY